MSDSSFVNNATVINNFPSNNIDYFSKKKFKTAAVKKMKNTSNFVSYP